MVLTRYGQAGASSRLRFYQYLPILRRHGWTADVHALLSDQYVGDLYKGRRRRVGSVVRAYIERILVLLRSGSYDLLWIQGELFPWMPALGERFLYAMGVRYVVDYDDAIFHRYDRHRSGLARFILGRKIDSIMRNAVLVVAGNAYLAERARNAGSRWVEMVPTVVDLSRYPRTDPEARETVRIGWIGTPSTVGYLSNIEAALREVTSGGAAQLVLIGVDSSSLTGLAVEYVPWSEDTESSALRSVDIGIMPLDDGPWERGKCGYKLIQYMACERPVVASPVGVNETIVDDGRSGFIAANDEEWATCLRILMGDIGLRRDMGRAGRARVEAGYSLQVAAARLVDLFQEAAES